MKKRGGKDSRPIGITRSILATKQELQQYGALEKNQNGNDFRRAGGQTGLESFENTHGSLYPPIKMPNEKARSQ